MIEELGAPGSKPAPAASAPAAAGFTFGRRPISFGIPAAATSAAASQPALGLTFPGAQREATGPASEFAFGKSPAAAAAEAPTQTPSAAAAGASASAPDQAPASSAPASAPAPAFGGTAAAGSFVFGSAAHAAAAAAPALPAPLALGSAAGSDADLAKQNGSRPGSHALSANAAAFAPPPLSVFGSGPAENGNVKRPFAGASNGEGLDITNRARTAISSAHASP